MTTARHPRAPQLTTLAIHAVAVAFGLAFLAGALEPWGSAFAPDATPVRLWLLGVASVVYLVRFTITQFVMLKRPFPWDEALFVGPWVAMLQVGLVMLGGNVAGPLGWVAVAGAVLYAVGSYLNTASEAMRLVWKRDPAHRGRIYDKSLFAYSMHINFFGDSLLFTGFAMIAGTWWAAMFPAVMTAMFVGYHIPRLDQHLADHYGEQFRDYSARVKKFAPFVY